MEHGVYRTLMCGLWIFAGPGLYYMYLPGNVISATVSFVYINLLPCKFPSTTAFGRFHNFEKN